jgi:hypothetical protein
VPALQVSDFGFLVPKHYTLLALLGPSLARLKVLVSTPFLASVPPDPQHLPRTASAAPALVLQLKERVSGSPQLKERALFVRVLLQLQPRVQKAAQMLLVL